jgi:hypothetical protein
MKIAYTQSASRSHNVTVTGANTSGRLAILGLAA